jgi:heavy metal sensor kinase
MKPLSLRLKLTAWYGTILAATFLLFGAVSFYAMRKSIDVTVDEELHNQIKEIQKLMQGLLPEGRETLEGELRENFELRPGADFPQIADKEGQWIYRSPFMRRYDIPLPKDIKAHASSLMVNGLPLRTLTAVILVDNKTFGVQVAIPVDDFEEALRRFRWVLLIVSPLLLITASAGGYWMSRRALTPVDEIIRDAESISPQNLSRRLPVPASHDELQRLSRTLNSMLGRLEAAFKRMTQFTADASHELRTPVTLMRTTAELSLRKARPDTNYRIALAEILKELENTSSLIERLMLLARADSGVETLQRFQFNLVDLFRVVCEEARVLAEAKQIDFRQRIPSAQVMILGDAQALQRLFLVLIDNAVKFTAAQGQITASLTLTDRFAVVEILDTGVGIAESDLPHIFERFYRADKNRSREPGGSGLGLSIARWIADAHGAKIDAESTPGKGSSFRVRLPLSGDQTSCREGSLRSD